MPNTKTHIHNCLNVLHVVYRGGASVAQTEAKNAQALSTGIEQQGHTSTVFTLVEPTKVTFISHLKTAISLKKVLKKTKTDVIHVHSAALLTPIWLATFFGSKKAKIICSFRVHTPQLSWWQKHALRRLSAAVTPIKAPTFLPKTVPTAPIPAGVDTNIFSIKEIPPAEIDTLWAEWDVPSKTKVLYVPTESLAHTLGLSALITALGKLKNASFKVIIAGDYNKDPATFTTLWQHVNDAGLSQKTLFIGTPTLPETLPYSAADIVITTTTDAFSAQTLLKAQAMGKPVIAPQESSHLFKEGQTGWAFNPQKPQTLPTALQKAFADNVTLHRMGKAGVSYVKNQYTTTHTTTTILALYQEALCGSVKPPSRIDNLQTGAKIALTAGLVLLGASLSACAENFTWQDPKTWHFRLSEEAKQEKALREACAAPTTPAERRVILLDGVADRVEHTECHPYTKRPLTPQRFEGR